MPYYPDPEEAPEPSEDFSPQQSGGGSSEEDERRSGRSQLDNLQDANRLREKLSGKGEGGAGATDAAGTAGAGGEMAGEGAGTATGSAGGAAVTGSGGAAASSAGGAAASATAGGAGAATGTIATGGAAVSTSAGVGVGGALSSTGVGALVGAPLIAASAATNDKGRKAIIFGGCGCLSLVVFLAVGVMGAFVGGGNGEAAGDGGNNSSRLTISKTVTPNIIPKGTANAVVTYTITVKNQSDKDAANVVVSDTFSSAPGEATAFAASITGYEASYSIGILSPGQTNTKTFTVTIPNTDFDPGWVLTNLATVTGSIDSGNESSSANATIIIGNPPIIPPTGCPMDGDITTPYGSNIPGYVVVDGKILDHDGVDLGNHKKDNAPVYATISGILTYANYNSQNNGELTQRIIISNGIYQVEYFHLSENGKAPEGPVVIGQKIGNEDETGYTAGEHLHYEIRVNGNRVNPTEFMSASLNYTQPAANDFTGFEDLDPWGTCNTLPQEPITNPPPLPPVASEYFNFSDAGDKAWTQAEKDAVSKAILTPVQSATWKNLVFGAGKVTITRSFADTSCPDVCSGYASGANTLILRDYFFTLPDNGQVFVITHELTHILQKRSPQVETAFRASPAYQEFLDKGVVRSYPLCSGSGETCPGYDDITPFNENFAEMAGNYVADRNNYPLDFPLEYPEHYKFARDSLFGGTSF